MFFLKDSRPTNSALVVPAMHSERWFQEYMWEKDKDCHSQGCHKNPAEEFHCLLHSPYIIFDVISVSFLSQIYSNSRCAVDVLTAVVMSWLTNYYTCLLYVLNCSFLIKLNYIKTTHCTGHSLSTYTSWCRRCLCLPFKWALLLPA